DRGAAARPRRPGPLHRAGLRPAGGGVPRSRRRRGHPRGVPAARAPGERRRDLSPRPPASASAPVALAQRKPEEELLARLRQAGARLVLLPALRRRQRDAPRLEVPGVLADDLVGVEHEPEHLALLLEVLVLVEQAELAQRVLQLLVAAQLGRRDHLEGVLEGRKLRVELLDALLEHRDLLVAAAGPGAVLLPLLPHHAEDEVLDRGLERVELLQRRGLRRRRQVRAPVLEDAGDDRLE